MIKKFKKINLFFLKSPLKRLNNIESLYNHKGLWIKQESMLGEFKGGNKLRCLEYLLGHASQLKAKNIIAFGAYDSNLIKIISHYVKRENLNLVAFVSNLSVEKTNYSKKVDKHTKIIKVPKGIGYFLNFALKNDYLKYIRFYSIPFGGANEYGCIGQIYAVRELKSQFSLRQEKLPDFIFVPVGSGGTIAGIIAGLLILGIESKVVGVNIVNKKSKLRIVKLVKNTICLYDKEINFTMRKIKSKLIIENKYLDRGYGSFSKKNKEVVKFIKNIENINIDEIYNAKTLCAFLDYAKSKPNEKLIFWNTSS